MAYSPDNRRPYDPETGTRGTKHNPAAIASTADENMDDDTTSGATPKPTRPLPRLTVTLSPRRDRHPKQQADDPGDAKDEPLGEANDGLPTSDQVQRHRLLIPTWMSPRAPMEGTCDDNESGPPPDARSANAQLS